MEQRTIFKLVAAIHALYLVVAAIDENELREGELEGVDRDEELSQLAFIKGNKKGAQRAHLRSVRAAVYNVAIKEDLVCLGGQS